MRLGDYILWFIGIVGIVVICVAITFALYSYSLNRAKLCTVPENAQTAYCLRR